MGDGIRFATSADAIIATAIWREAAQDLKNRGIPLWEPDHIHEAQAENLALAQELVLGFAGGLAMACMVIQDEDAVHWPGEAPGSAFYLHRIARRPIEEGRGWATRLISWAQVHAKEAGVERLRLDCDPRPQLMSLYRGLGFRHVDLEPINVGRFRAVRFEMDLENTNIP